MNDLLYKGHFKGLDIAFTYAVTTQAVNESIVRHNCDPAAAHILGRATTGALLAAAILRRGSGSMHAGNTRARSRPSWPMPGGTAPSVP